MTILFLELLEKSLDGALDSRLAALADVERALPRTIDLRIQGEVDLRLWPVHLDLATS